ncbi:MAG: bis(5'-nucleosyl)-tetraphosphatase (symmetrical) YqeK [Clostridia bacterium]|nr:bis(5'-nucleosyl)-tetraphosphatase (symmetrical) YqeK [Clostridia bacterium]
MQKLGILGGTFDPIHEGHLALGRAALSAGGLDRIILMPMARPAHREADASAADRLSMCRIAAADEPSFLVSNAGMSSGVKYTLDTLGPLRREFPGALLTFIIGADKLTALPYWYGAEKLFSQVDFLCFPRGGISTDEALAKARAAGVCVKMLSGYATPYSASLIRAQTAQYEDAPGLAPNVLAYMAQRGLYQTDYLPRIRTMMNPRRFQHTLGVRKEAVRLALLHEVPVQRAALAAILHDCAKGMSVKEMNRIAEENHLMEDPAMLSSGPMMHGPVGAYIAKTQFGVRDEGVLDAIRSHTIGRPGMSKLEMCLFVADATEEYREEYEGLKELRYLADRSLPAAVLLSIQLTQRYLERTNRPFYPIVFETMNYLKSILTEREKRLLTDIDITSI